MMLKMKLRSLTMTLKLDAEQNKEQSNLLQNNCKLLHKQLKQ